MRAALLTAPVALVLVLAGCGGEEEQPTTPSASTRPVSTASTASTTAPTTEPTTTAPADDGSGGEGGGDAEDSPGSNPETALEAFFVSGDPDLVCGELATDDLVADAYGDEAGCRAAQAPGATPESIEIVELETSGETTEAVVVPEGGPNDGFEHDVTLVLEGDSWLVDSLEADIPAGP